jgi:hypothetical protein
MTPDDLRSALAELMHQITQQLAGQPPGATLDAWLNREHGPDSATFDRLRALCEAGVRDGWLCQREGGGIRYGRIFKPTDDLHGFSVDVVDMNDIAGPHHVHPHGEIDLVMPQGAPDAASDARFDGRPAGWCVYPPGSAHWPTVTGGRALVLYLLPQGAIEFTGRTREGDRTADAARQPVPAPQETRR